MIIETCSYRGTRYIFRKNGSSRYLYLTFEDFQNGNYIYCPNKKSISNILKEEHSLYCNGITNIKNKQHTFDYEDISEKKKRLGIIFNE